MQSHGLPAAWWAVPSVFRATGMALPACLARTEAPTGRLSGGWREMIEFRIFACPRSPITTYGDCAHKITGKASDTSTLMRRLSKTLQAPIDLQRALKQVGKTEHFCCGSTLFHAGDGNTGVFLVCDGRVCLQVPGAPHFDRTFSAGSILGLPSTFIGKPYSLTAVCVTDCEVAHAGKKEFLDLMSRHLDLCREATEILSREVAFIFSALSKCSQGTRKGKSEATLRAR